MLDLSIRCLDAMRYVTPLREGGSLPAVIEASDGDLYVMKFVGAGQGPKALVAELIAGEIGRTLGFNIPEIIFLQMDEALGRSEPDEEIQDLLRASVGLNLGMRFLPQAFAFDVLLEPPLPGDLASRIVWFDAFITNVDRTARNVNMLIWQEKLWLIDHGASLYFHHSWEGYQERMASPFPLIRDHTLLPLATNLAGAHQALASQLSAEIFAAIVDQVPDAWLGSEDIFTSPEEQRRAYVEYLTGRLAAADQFLAEADRARNGL